MEDGLDLVLAERAFHEPGSAEIAVDHIDLVLEPHRHERGPSRAIAADYAHAGAVVQQSLDEPRADQAVGPGHEHPMPVQRQIFHGASPTAHRRLSATASLYVSMHPQKPW